MVNFWENIARYPRFFISATTGLFLILLSPFAKLFRTKLGKIFFLFIFFMFLTILIIIINAMLDI